MTQRQPTRDARRKGREFDPDAFFIDDEFDDFLDQHVAALRESLAHALGH